MDAEVFKTLEEKVQDVRGELTEICKELDILIEKLIETSEAL